MCWRFSFIVQCVYARAKYAAFETSTIKGKQLIILKIENCRFNVFILHEIWIVQLLMHSSLAQSASLSLIYSFSPFRGGCESVIASDFASSDL